MNSSGQQVPATTAIRGSPTTLVPEFQPLQVPTMSLDATHLIEARPAGRMGDGIFARKDMPAGTRISSETPIVTVPGNPMQRTLAENIAAFCKAARHADPRRIWRMGNLSSGKSVQYDPQTIEIIQDWVEENHPEATRCVLFYAKLFSIYLRYAVKPPHRDEACVFYYHGLINHSCSPNASSSYNRVNKCQQVHLIRDVKAGDQIFVSYNRFQAFPRDMRHSDIRDQGHNFVCDCPLCTSQEAEAILQRINDLYMSLSNFLVKEAVVRGWIDTFSPTPNDNEEALALAEELVGLFRHPSVDLVCHDLKVTLHICSLINRRLGNIKAAASYAREELALQVRLWGFEAENYHDSDDVVPRLHKLEKELCQMEAGGF